MAASLAVVVVLAWIYLWRTAAGMMPVDMPGMPDMPMSMPESGNASGFALTFVMWTVMMVGMMLPGAAPTILLYGTLVRGNRERGTVLPGVWVFTAGYLAVWTAFSALAALLQMQLAQASLLTPMMVSSSRELSAALLVTAGIYQWLPFKDACLGKCRAPLQFLLVRWRPGVLGALRMGAESGAYCLGCCWALMLILFVAGVMNLAWVAVIAAFVFAEKLLPGRYVSAIAGAALVVAGVALLL